MNRAAGNSGNRALLAEERGVPATREEATRSWYDEIYLPMTQFIRDARVLDQHPERTEADFYVWLVRHWDEALLRGSSHVMITRQGPAIVAIPFEHERSTTALLAKVRGSA